MQLINLPINDIKIQYEKLFNNSNWPDAARDLKEQSELDALIVEFKMNKSDKDYIKLKSNSVRTLIDSLSNGKAVGFSCVSNEMLKYGNTPLVTDTLTYLYEWMINSGSVPELFNISILKPLVKDSKKSQDDLNNLRPLSISDVYTTVYEKILLNEVRSDHKDHPKQLGFKVNSSCAHANFIL